MTTRLGYIGVGAMGRSHIGVFREHFAGEAEGVALFDPHEPSRAAALELLPGAKVYSSAQALIESELDAVVISSPNCTHAEYAVAALAARKHVFSEKPVATTAEDCCRLVRTADRSRYIVFIGQEMPYSPFCKKTEELLGQGVLGAVQMVWCKEFRPPFLRKVDQWIIDERFSGGAMVDKNCHHFDVMNRWAGSRPRRVAAFGSRRFNQVLGVATEVIDNASVSFEYENGVVGTLQLCMFGPDRGEDCLEMGIIGDKGLLQTQLGRHALTVWPRDRKGLQGNVVEFEADPLGGHAGFIQEHQAFLAAVRDGIRAPTNVRQCVGGTLLAIAAEAAIKRGGVVEVPREC